MLIVNKNYNCFKILFLLAITCFTISCEEEKKFYEYLAPITDVSMQNNCVQGDTIPILLTFLYQDSCANSFRILNENQSTLSKKITIYSNYDFETECNQKGILNKQTVKVLMKDTGKVIFLFRNPLQTKGKLIGFIKDSINVSRRNK